MNDPEPNVTPISVTQSTNDPKQNAPPASIVPVTPITPSIIATPELKWITHLSSLIVVLAAAAYLIGFIVVNSSLFKYGMVPYDFLQARYVSAGLLFLAATAGFTSLYVSLIFLAKRKHYASDTINAEIKSSWIIFFVFAATGPYIKWLWVKAEQVEWWLQYLEYPSLILAIVFMFLPAFVLPLSDRFSSFYSWWRKHLWQTGLSSLIILFLMLIYSTATLGWAFAFYPIFLVSILFFTSGFRSNIKQEAAVSENTHGLLWGVINMCLSISLFATLTYPLISPHVGGGKPLLVSLSLKPEHNHTLGKIMGREDWKCVMHNISLIHENSELIYILPHGYLANDSAIAIPKGELVSIAYQKKEKSEQSTCLE